MLGIFIFVNFSCSSGLLKYKKEPQKFKNVEFEKTVQIEEPDAAASEVVSESKTAPETLTTSNSLTENSKKIIAVKENKKNVIQKSNSSKTKAKNKLAQTNSLKAAEVKPIVRLPEIEDNEGFDVGVRRPLVDPFRVGEKVEHEVSYLGASAGNLIFSVKPFAIVNGKKAYNFYIDLKSNSFFSRVYAVDDQVQTYVDYEELVPRVFKVNIRDSGQVKEAQSFFDFNTLKANYWEHKYTEKDGHSEKKLSWSILPYSQNSFSAIFYMRVFKWVIGKEYAFRVADDEKNVTFKAKAIEKTKLSTDAGTFPAIKIKAEVVSRGNLSNASNFYMWLSDDDRKYILRIEVKLPVGSLVSEAIQIKAGQN